MPRLDIDGSELPTGVCIKKVNTVNPYEARFSFNGKQINVGHFTTAAAAVAGIEKRRAECEADHTMADKQPRPDRYLPKGVSVQKGSKHNPYVAKFSHLGKNIFIACYPTPELAFEAVNNKRKALDLPPYAPLGASKAVKLAAMVPRTFRARPAAKIEASPIPPIPVLVNSSNGIMPPMPMPPLPMPTPPVSDAQAVVLRGRTDE